MPQDPTRGLIVSLSAQETRKLEIQINAQRLSLLLQANGVALKLSEGCVEALALALVGPAQAPMDDALDYRSPARRADYDFQLFSPVTKMSPNTHACAHRRKGLWRLRY